MHYSDHRHVMAALLAAAETHPDKTLSVFNGRCRLTSSRSFAEYLSAARAMAGRLQNQGVKPGDRVMICLSNSAEWLDLWAGCIWLGAWPVAASPGFAMGSAAYREEKTFGIAGMLDARLLVCGEALRKSAGVAPSGLGVITPEEMAADAADGPDGPYDADPNDIAYLQLTSGSTGMPKAAQVTHRGMLHNVWAMFDAATRRRGGQPPRSGTTWLPLFHDFGLVMSIGGMMNGVGVSVFPPNAFMSRPAAWLTHLGTLDAPMCGSPNFGLHHAVNRVSEQDLTQMNLSGWHTCFIGAEMTRAETLEHFLRKFGRAGCPAAMLAPSYGMAEATLGVTLDQRAQGLRMGLSEPDDKGERVKVVSCGAPLQETELKVLSQSGEVLPDGHVGEIYLRAGGVISGYFRNREATQEAFVDGWLRTGDLGFLQDGEVFLTGRIKDVLIVNGSNHMPDELEHLAEREIESAGMERAAAFTTMPEGQGEIPVLVVEIDRRKWGTQLEKLAERIAGKISRELGLPLHEVVFVNRGSIPRTTSGKLQRAAVRRAYHEGTLKELTLAS